MTDKVQKIREEVEKLRIKNTEAFDCGCDGTKCAGYDMACDDILSFIDSLQEEPISDFEMALTEMIDKAQKCVVEPWAIAAQWKDELIKLAKSEESVNNDLEEEIKQYLNKEVIVTNEDVVISKHHEFHNFYVDNLEEVARHFANWQKQQIMKDAIDGKIYETQARSKLKAVTTGNLSRLDYKVGDKVKVIVIKED